MKVMILSTGASSLEVKDTLVEGALGQLPWHLMLIGIISYMLGCLLHDILSFTCASNEH